MSGSLRADAARNRQQLLVAAAQEFAEHGLEASVADIARRAGVGKGTVFRHFSTKDDLVGAIIVDRLHHLSTVCQQLIENADSIDPAAALLQFMTAAAGEQQRVDLSFVQYAATLSEDVYQARADLHHAVGIILGRAQVVGEIRADITAIDIMVLVCAPQKITVHLADGQPDLWQRYLALIFDGLRPDSPRPLPQPAPPPA